jgi:ribosomal protein L40E
MVCSMRMRILANIIAAIIAAFGSIFLVAILASGLVAGSAGAGFVVIGVLLLLISVIIARSASTKICPQCAERAKVKALKCGQCGHEFAAPRASIGG